jgi:colanic acid/amylovoran biosynthesis glycosyltransferase
MTLAIASPSASAYSETFIHMQMERLPCILRIHGGPVASETIPGGLVKPMKNLRGILDTAIEWGLRGKRWDGPQARELGRRLHRAGVTVLLANYGQTGCALMPLCHELGVRLVVHFHGYDAHMTRVLSDYRERYRELGQKAGAVIAVSEKMREALTSYGIPKSKICLVRYGVDPSAFREKQNFPSTPLFFGVGRFVDKKAPYLTLLAFRQVLDAFPDARLVLAGEGELWEATRNLAEALGIEQAVSFPGVILPERVARYMQEATAFVQHSVMPRYGPMAGDSEGTPVAVTEALMTGLPVISTRHAGIGEVVRDGESGFLVDERDTRAMANAMMTLAGDPAKAAHMGKSARQDATAKYTASHYIDALYDILRA